MLFVDSHLANILKVNVFQQIHVGFFLANFFTFSFYCLGHNVTYEGIEDLIAKNDRKGCPDYVKALVSAQEFIENPRNYFTFPEGFQFPQKPRPPTRIDRRPVKNDVDMVEEKAVKNVPKVHQNGLTLSNCKFFL